MYVDHFNLSDTPFNNCPSDGFFTPNEEFGAAVARMEQVLLSRDAVAVITGGPGVGKTTIVATAAKRVGGKAVVAYVDMRLADPDLLFDLLLLNLGAESSGGDQSTALFRLKSTIARHNEESGCKITAVIDVSSLTIERAKRILQLVHMAGEPGGQMNVVLLGPHILHKLMDTPGLIHMRQRVTFRYRARPLTVGETDAYLKAQIDRSGGQANALLVHGTSIVVYRYVGGVPRLINTLMDATLSHAAKHDIESISPNEITEVAELLGWRPLAGNKASISRKSASVPATVIPRRQAEAPVNTDAQPPGSLELSPAEPAQPDAVEPQQAGALDAAAASAPEPLSVGSGTALKASTVPEANDTPEAQADPMRSSAPESSPISSTAMLMAAAFREDVTPDVNDATEPRDAQPETQWNDETASVNDGQETSHSGVPAMDAKDTGATGMLRLEDLDARFAETIFGDDTGAFKIDDDSEIKKAAG